MPQNDFFYKIRQWDNRAAQWMGRHFYIILFEIILAIIFIFWFINLLKTINISFYVKNNPAGQLLLAQTVNMALIVMLLLLIALGVLNLINTNTRLRGVLKNIEYNLSRRRSDQKPSQED